MRRYYETFELSVGSVFKSCRAVSRANIVENFRLQLGVKQHHESNLLAKPTVFMFYALVGGSKTFSSLLQMRAAENVVNLLCRNFTGTYKAATPVASN